jgi:type IV secretory pathway TraG/TraD family ATPase VirD4
MAESAGWGLTFLLGAQDYAQLAERWGKDGATAMWSNLTNKVVFPGISNPDTLRQLEQLAGTRWGTQTSSTTTRGHRRQQSHSSTESQIQLPRWTQDALYGLPPDQCLVFRPDWPHPYLQPQSRAYLTEPFSTWARMPWPIEDGELTLAGRAAQASTPASAPPR